MPPGITNRLRSNCQSDVPRTSNLAADQLTTLPCMSRVVKQTVASPAPWMRTHAEASTSSLACTGSRTSGPSDQSCVPRCSIRNEASALCRMARSGLICAAPGSCAQTFDHVRLVARFSWKKSSSVAPLLLPANKATTASDEINIFMVCSCGADDRRCGRSWKSGKPAAQGWTHRERCQRPPWSALGCRPRLCYTPAHEEAEQGQRGTCPYTAAAGRASAIVDTRVIYCGDNLDQLKKLPAAGVDLLGRMNNIFKGMINDQVSPITSAFQELFLSVLATASYD